MGFPYSALFLLCCGFVGLSSASTPYSFDYLYIDAGEGDSSGGHAAIRFADETYHFQYYDNGLLRAVRDNSTDFEYKYRFLANRSIQVRRVPVNKETYHLLRDHFNSGYQAQTQLFQNMDASDNDIKLIQQLLNLPTDDNKSLIPQLSLNIKGAGLFLTNDDRRAAKSVRFKTPQKPYIINALYRRIENRFGRQFIHQKLEKYHNSVAQLKLSQWDTDTVSLLNRTFHKIPYSFSRRYNDLAEIIVALETLKNSPQLSEDALFSSDTENFRLNGSELRDLRQYQNKLNDNLVDLVNSNRPDWGYAFLVGVARLIAIDKSIKYRRLVFLDTYANQPEYIGKETIEQHREVFETLARESQIEFQKAKKRIFSAKTINERFYADLESNANQTVELFHSLENEKPLRQHSGNLAPLKERTVNTIALPKLNQKELNAGLRHAQAFQSMLLERLYTDYRYDLFSRNCVTEIFSNINQAFLNPSRTTDNNDFKKTPEILVTKNQTKSESISKLGGYVESDFLNIIPFVSAQDINNEYRHGQKKILISYRKKRLQAMFQTGSPVWVYLRESNVISSTIYKVNSNDSFFVFFTDDLIYLRPIFGAVNAVSGLAQSTLGILTLPADYGNNLLKGIKGFLVSLPELVFFNMRKGSFEYQPYHSLMETEAEGGAI